MRDKWIIRLGYVGWLIDGEGDPPRTMVRKSAKVYRGKSSALRALAYYMDKNNHRDQTKWKVEIL